LKIFDCVPFFNEFDQLRLRIACLEDVVDGFLVMEAHQTHTGKAKPLYLAESGRADLLGHSKISVRAVDLPKGYSHWEREQYQREAIGPALASLGAAPQDVVMVSDVDEIPAAAAVRRAREVLGAGGDRTILVFEQRMFYFRLNYELVWSRKLPWLGTAAARFGDAPSVNGLRTTGRNTRGRHALGYDRGARVYRVPDAGWHFSYLGGDEALELKLASYAHQESGVQQRRRVSVQGLIDARASLFPRKGLEEVWAVMPPEAVGLPEAAVARAGVAHLFQSPHDSTADILRRVRAAGVPRRWRLGRFDLGYARRSPWPRLGED
jgi:beta-1,4-mannosyl-glycoprotein beta-1,4-N-acetylglucosaminyltransferase